MYPETMEEAERGMLSLLRRVDVALACIYQDAGFDHPAYVAADRAVDALRHRPASEIPESEVYAAADVVSKAFEARLVSERGRAVPNDAIELMAERGELLVAEMCDAGKSIDVLR